MIEPIVMAVIFTGFILLFFSIHLYMDIRMFCSRRMKADRSEFVIPLWAKILAFPPSLVFWVMVFATPFLFYFRVYESTFTPILLRWSHETLLQVAGLTLMLGGVLLADWGRVSRGVIAPSGAMPEGYQLSTRGAYGLVRHPMYASYSLFFIGLPLALLNIPLFLCILGIPGYYGIAKAEENILTKKFGEQYIKYQKKVGMFLPKLIIKPRTLG